MEFSDLSQLSINSFPAVSIPTNIISYRFAGLHDIESISMLAQKTYKQTYSPTLAYYTEDVIEGLFGKSFRENILPYELNNPKLKYFICEDNQTEFGYAKLEFKADRAYLDKLYLLNEYQGRGYGHKMIQMCLQSALDHGYKTMTLDVWAKNDKAIKFYKKYGFQSGAAKRFFLFGTIPTNEYNLEMTCSDITSYVSDSTRKVRM